jgi:hypothetical protein
MSMTQKHKRWTLDEAVYACKAYHSTHNNDGSVPKKVARKLGRTIKSCDQIVTRVRAGNTPLLKTREGRRQLQPYTGLTYTKGLRVLKPIPTVESTTGGFTLTLFWGLLTFTRE